MTDEGRKADARDRLAALRNGFARRLRERIAELEDAIDSGVARRVEDLAHRLAGTAGSYGFHAVSEESAALEALCQDRFDEAKARAIVERMWKSV